MKRILKIKLNLDLQRFKNKDTSDTHEQIMGMRDIYIFIDDLYTDDNIEIIDKFVKQFVESDFSFQFHICVLSATRHMKEKLNNRELLWKNTERLGLKLLDKEELDMTLSGLR